MNFRVPLACIVALAPCAAQAAGTLQSAEVTRVYNKVDLLQPEQSAVPAKVGDDVAGSTAVQTGGQSRAELQFNDATIARLGANSVFSFDRGTRDLNLNEGVILLEVPKNAGGATINTAAVTAAVTGTTVMIESRKGKGGKGVVKFIVLEGTMRLTLNGRSGESILLGPGQMITMRAGDTRLPEPQVVDVGRLSKTSGLMNSREFGPLKNEPYIVDTVNQQQVLKAKGKLINVNYALAGKKKNPVLSVISSNSQSSLRTDSTLVKNKPRNPVTRSNPKPPVPHRPAKPVHPPKPPPPVQKPPLPPKQPPKPRPQPPVQPPPVPPAPSVQS